MNKVQQSASERAENIRLIQRQLQTLGFYDGAIDGVWGQRSTSALRAFYRMVGFSGDFDHTKARHLYWAAKIKDARKVSVGQAVEDARTAVSASNDFSRAHEANEAGRYSEAKRRYEQALRRIEQVLGEDHLDTLSTAKNLGSVYTNLSRYAEAERLYRRALEGEERVLGKEHPSTLGTVGKLASLYMSQGRYEKAEQLYRRALEGKERVLGKEHSGTLNTADNLAVLYMNQGRYEEAEELHRRALDGKARVLGKEHPSTLNTAENLANLHKAEGHYEEAEDLYWLALGGKESVLGKEHPDTLGTVENLANLYTTQGRYEEAEQLYRRALESVERVLGKEHPRTLGTVGNLAVLYMNQGRYQEAEQLYRRALEGRKRVLGKEHPRTLGTVGNLANLYMSQGRYEEAEQLYRRALEGKERALSKDHPHTLNAVGDLASLYMSQGRYEEAEQLYGSALNGVEQVLGDAHPDTLRMVNNLATLHRAQNDRAKAIELVQRAYSALPDYVASGSAARDANGKLDLPIDFAGHFASVSASHLSVSEQATRSFEGQGWWTFGRLDVALNDLGARLAAGNEQLASVVRDFQEARGRLSRLRDAYVRSFDDRENGEAVRKSLSGQIEMTEKEFEALKARIERDFPELAELTLPRSLKAEEAQDLLEPGEGLVAYAATDDKLYAWLVTQERMAWVQVPVTKERLRHLVDRLGASVDLTRTAPDTQVRERCAVTSDVAGMENRVFDPCKAKELHNLVLGAFDLSGLDTLIVVPDGPLETVPFSMLVTGFDGAGEPKWLIENYAIAMLPTTSSLRALRQSGIRTEADERKPYLGLAPATFSDRDASSPLRGELADLPGTENEVRFLSGLLGSGRDGYVTGNEASEAFVKSTPLKDYRVLSFATHGLLSRQTRDLTAARISEPALVLASSEDEDGLLTASEAATLRLDADWVLLSGCNTASGDAADAEGLSGLARAFFFAGARSLLVSHWSIDDDAAMDVMVETMKRSTGRNRLGKAQALRQAMLTVMNKPGYEHPFFWAPFSLVGVGR